MTLHKILLIGFFLGFNIARAAPTSSSSPLSEQEKQVFANLTDQPVVIARTHIILFWPSSWRPAWFAEAKVESPEALADWLEKAFVQMQEWTSYDPNAGYLRFTGKSSRLMFIFDSKHFDYVWLSVVKGPRIVGFHDPVQMKPGTADWFGWLTHELSHDFWNKNPDFDKSRAVWKESLCDFMRLHLLESMGMGNEAKAWRKKINDGKDTDQYKGGAKKFLLFSEGHALTSPKDFFVFLKTNDPTKLFGTPPWAK